MTAKINTLDQIKNTSKKVYVRWSKSIALDNKRGYSLRCGTQSEAGLSCCEIDKTWEDWRILRQLSEYRFVGGSCWIITGEEVGTGADNEPLLKNVNLIGKVSDSLLSINYRKAELEQTIADDEERLTRITDAIAIQIIAKHIEKNKQLLKSI